MSRAEAETSGVVSKLSRAVPTLPMEIFQPEVAVMLDVDFPLGVAFPSEVAIPLEVDVPPVVAFLSKMAIPLVKII